MHDFHQLAAELEHAPAHKIILSAPEKDAPYRKITVMRAGDIYRAEKLTVTQAFHENIDENTLAAWLTAQFAAFDRLDAWTGDTAISARKTKKGALLISRRKESAPVPTQTGHNRDKAYLIQEGTVVPPLVDMGAMTKDGRIAASMQHKFRQINRYLEIIDDAVRAYGDRPLHIVDFGCGKSYLTFIVYYYFTVLRGIPVTMAGVDLKKDVIDFCNQVAAKYGYSGLSFICGDIAKYAAEKPVDMVISLHACDTATDHVLANAVRWGAGIILSAPCCHHELAGQISMDALPALSRYGILTERFAAMLTDGIRADLLTAHGYRTQVMEFVELSHTPKNLLIRAVKANLPWDTRDAARARVDSAIAAFGVCPTLCGLLAEERP